MLHQRFQGTLPNTQVKGNLGPKLFFYTNSEMSLMLMIWEHRFLVWSTTPQNIQRVFLHTCSTMWFFHNTLFQTWSFPEWAEQFSQQQSFLQVWPLLAQIQLQHASKPQEFTGFKRLSRKEYNDHMHFFKKEVSKGKQGYSILFPIEFLRFTIKLLWPSLS